MTHPTLSPELQTSLDELSAAITKLRADHDRALDTLNTMRVILKVPMEARLKVSALETAMDLYDRPMEREEECPACGQVAVLDGSRNGSMTFAAPVCYDCRNPEREPNSLAERNGDA